MSYRIRLALAGALLVGAFTFTGCATNKPVKFGQGEGLQQTASTEQTAVSPQVAQNPVMPSSYQQPATAPAPNTTQSSWARPFNSSPYGGSRAGGHSCFT